MGFSARNSAEIITLYTCRVCSLIFREPFQLACAHRQCKDCIIVDER